MWIFQWLNSNRENKKKTKKISKLIKQIQNDFATDKYRDISVFISSTKYDLESERSRVNEVIKKMGFNLRSMEEFGARPEKPITVCLSELDKADIYVCILAMKYGSFCTDKKYSKKKKRSYTEIEYDHALDKARKNNNVPRILIYCIDEHRAKLHPENVDTGDKAEKLKKFKEKVKRNHTVFPYVGLEDLIQRIARDVAHEADNIISKRGEKTHPIGSNDINCANGMSITLLPDLGSISLRQPISISGTATGIQNSELYVFIAAESPNFPPPDEKLLPMNERGDRFVSVPLSADGSWSHVLSLKHLLSASFKDIYKPDYNLIVSSVPRFDMKGPAIALTNPIKLRSGFVSITSVDQIQTSEHPYVIQGVAYPPVPHVFLWICSLNRVYDRIKIELNPYGEFDYTLPKEVTDKLTKGQYFGIVDVPFIHPDGVVQLVTEGGKPFLFKEGKNELLPGDTNVAIALCKLLDDSSDLYAKFSFIAAGAR